MGPLWAKLLCPLCKGRSLPEHELPLKAVRPQGAGRMLVLPLGEEGVWLGGKEACLWALWALFGLSYQLEED